MVKIGLNSEFTKLPEPILSGRQEVPPKLRCVFIILTVFALKVMNFVSKMMDFVSKVMDLYQRTMDFVQMQAWS